MSDNIMKKRLLMLIKLLQDHTDEDHPVSTRDIMAYYKENGMSSDRKTLDADIKLLQEQGFDLIKIKSSPNKYYIASREFELPELKLLIDAVQSSRFITEKKSRELSKKLAGLASAEQAKELDRHTGVNGRAKSTNEQQLYTVDTITKAINEKKKIRYQYQEYDGKKRKILRNDGEVYILSPYMLYWNEDFYYVVGYSDKRECITAFRVDRIVNIETTDEKVTFESDKALDNDLKLEVTEKNDDEIKKGTEKVTEAYKDNKKVKEVKLINLYEIDVLNGNGRIEKLEDGKFTIAIAIPESDQKYDNYKVVYFDEEGKLVETLNAKLENGKVVFTTSHLSTYGVVGYNNVTETPTETKPEKNPTTSDINLALIISAIVISTIGVVITSKKISAKVTR